MLHVTLFTARLEALVGEGRGKFASDKTLPLDPYIKISVEKTRGKWVHSKTTLRTREWLQSAGRFHYDGRKRRLPNVVGE